MEVETIQLKIARVDVKLDGFGSRDAELFDLKRHLAWLYVFERKLQLYFSGLVCLPDKGLGWIRSKHNLFAARRFSREQMDCLVLARQQLPLVLGTQAPFAGFGGA